MHSKDTNDLPADIAELVLTELPNGQCAWLRPASPIDRYRLTERAIIVDQPDNGPRYVLTSRGRAAVHAEACAEQS
jgi:hypothetical protein